MAQNPIRVAAAATAGIVTGTLLEAIVKRCGYVLNVGETLGDLDFDTGEPPLLIHYAATGFDYFLDTTDTTTVDDGVTCLVSGNGLRYHIEDAASISRNSVLAFASVDPGAPVVGDAYIVNPAATGAFAGHDDDIAVYTRRGWIFATPEVGLTILNEATGTNWQYGTGGWAGFAIEIADSSVRPESLLKPLGIAVETTENTPPGSPSANTCWLVGTSPTGAFVGHENDVAYYKASAWNFIDAYEGATIFHKGNGFEMNFVSGSWLGGGGSEVQTFDTAGAATWTKPSKGNMALIQVWGAGGSGGRQNGSGGGGGGGGGAYVERLMPLSELASTVSVTVGAGGVAVTSGATDGNPGGDSSFGTHVVAYGGAGGDTAGGGGGGGGQTGAGSPGTSATVGGNGGPSLGGAGAVQGGPSTPAGASDLGGGGGGAADVGSTVRNGGASVAGGGGGGGGGNSNQGNGGASLRGGGGGGGGGTTTTGGASVMGGAGGAGAGGSTNATAGSQPGGGGGGSRTGNSGKGGDGRVRVTVF